MTITTIDPAAPVAEDWRRHAACANPRQQPDLWFPVGTTPAALEQEEAAKRICRSCPVIDVCLAWAVETGQEEGVWGGLGVAERRHRRRPGRRVAASFRKPAYAIGRCLEQQEHIEQRMSEGISRRQIAEEIGESWSTVQRAIDVFTKERATQAALDAASEAVDAA